MTRHLLALLAALGAATVADAETAPAPAEAAPPPAELPADPGAAPGPETLAAPAGAPPGPSTNVTVNLIRRLVERGVLTQEDATELIRQAEEDAAVAREQVAYTQTMAEQAAALAQAAAQTPDDLSLETEFAQKSEGSIRVTYIPEVVRQQLRDEVKAEVLRQARDERWAAPRLLPEWVTRVRLSGDVRGRYESIRFADGNDNTGAFPDFNAINTGDPFDVAGTEFSPQLNVDEDRERASLRVRVGAEVDLLGGFTAGVRIATGADNSPVSHNQTLGSARGQGGNFSKYAVWLDRGFLKYEIGSAERGATLTLGRFDNPFFCSEVFADQDVGFDGLAVQGRYRIIEGLTPFVAAGAFPVFNTALNYSSNRPDKFGSRDKWLLGVQAGATWRIRPDLEFKGAVAYYDFQDIEGKRSSPFTPLSPSDAGDTDATRPAFAQKGNTYMALRDIVPSELNNFGTTDQYQYFGLATPFRVLALTGRLDYTGFEPVQVSLTGEYLKNLAFNREAINRIAVNNRGASGDGGVAAFDGSDTAWIVGLRVGNAALEKLWDWSLGVNYRRVGSDAVVDGFTDSEFGGGGTNMKGFSVFGNLALGPNVFLGLRYMSADEVAGPPLRSDVIQVDLTGQF